ncbi:MAG TPA: LysR family transcriptional regulator [Nocardioides sp.]|nr:LysR family transcriptional regulator [Nocardioides sp.]
MWQAVELREIRVFLVLAEELHFGRTATRVGLTQSRVSQTIRDLERKLGTTLAERTSRRVTLTPAGERFRQEASGAVAGLDDVLRGTRAAGGRLTEPVRIGAVAAVAGGPRLREVVAAFEAAHPDSGVEFVGLPFADRFGPLRRGEVDLVVTHLPLEQPDLVAGPVLSREPFMLGVAVTNPLAERGKVTVEDLADHRIGDLDIKGPREMLEVLGPRQTPSGRPIPRLRLKAREPSEIMLAIAAGRIVQPVTATFAQTHRHPDVVFVPFGDLPMGRTVLAWRRRDRDPGLREFLRVLRAQPAQRRS